MRSGLGPVAAMAGLLVVGQLIALAVAPLFLALGFQAFEDPTDPLNPLLYIGLILVFTALLLAFIRFRRQNLARYFILGSIFLAIGFVFFVPIRLAFVGLDADLADVLANVFSFALAALLTYGLVVYPEWYLVDAVGLSVAAGVTAIMGISFAILPAFLLLIGLAIYDAWAVYRTKHMVALADEVTAQRLPILLVVPRRRGYSFLRQRRLKDQIAAGEEREAMFMGLGDVIVPGVLVVSAAIYLPAGQFLGAPANLVVALASLVGVCLGFALLMRFVLRGNPQAGLPLLNGGAILGYLVAFAVVYGTAAGNWSFGLLPGG